MSDQSREDEEGGSGDRADPSVDDQRGPSAKDGSRSDDTSDEQGDDEPEKTPAYKKPLFWIILVVAVAAIAIGGTLYWLHARQYESTDDAFVDTHLVRLAPQVAGTLIEVANVDNRHVDAGTLLAVIQPNGPEAQLGEARANVVQAQAQVAQAQAQVTAALASRAQAADQARVPLANAIKADQDLARYEALLRLDRVAVSAQAVDQARANARATAADAAAARRAIGNADAQVTVARRQVRAQEAAVGARRAQVEQAQVTLGNLRLKAPVSGQVVNRSVNLGSYVGPGTQLMAIVPDYLWITANFKETQLTLMRRGQPVAIHVDAFPEVEFRGHIDSIQRGAGQAFALLPPQNATGNYVKVVQRVPVRITFDVKNGPDPRMYHIGPGMSVVPTVKVR
jgi:membrane fusion protein (multidrug efflux system)